jgi:hypothetical protein
VLDTRQTDYVSGLLKVFAAREAAAASLWRALAPGLITPKNLAATKALRSRAARPPGIGRNAPHQNWTLAEPVLRRANGSVRNL